MRIVTHTRDGELIYPTVPYTYEKLAATFKALSTVEALKVVKLVMDKQPLYEPTPDGGRSYIVPAQVVEDLVQAKILEEENGKYYLHNRISMEGLRICYDWLGQTEAFSIGNLPPREEWPIVDDVIQRAKDTLRDAGYEPPPGIEQ